MENFAKTIFMQKLIGFKEVKGGQWAYKIISILRVNVQEMKMIFTNKCISAPYWVQLVFRD